MTFWFSAEQEEEESHEGSQENVFAEEWVEYEAGESSLVSEDETELYHQEESTEEPSTKHQDDGKWSNFFPKYTHFNRI